MLVERFSPRGANHGHLCLPVVVAAGASAGGGAGGSGGGSGGIGQGSPTTWDGNLVNTGIGSAWNQSLADGLRNYFTDIDGPSLFPKNYEFTPEEFAAALNAVIAQATGLRPIPVIAFGDNKVSAPIDPMYCTDVRSKMATAFGMTGNGTRKTEASFFVKMRGDGSYFGTTPISSNEYMKNSVKWDPAAIAFGHVHPNGSTPW